MCKKSVFKNFKNYNSIIFFFLIPKSIAICSSFCIEIILFIRYLVYKSSIEVFKINNKPPLHKIGK